MQKHHNVVQSLMSKTHNIKQILKAINSSILDCSAPISRDVPQWHCSFCSTLCNLSAYSFQEWVMCTNIILNAAMRCPDRRRLLSPSPPCSVYVAILKPLQVVSARQTAYRQRTCRTAGRATEASISDTSASSATGSQSSKTAELLLSFCRTHITNSRTSPSFECSAKRWL